MTMVRLARTELLELFLQEVESYLPVIRQKLTILSAESAAKAPLDELHRLFHNVKGAASQVLLVDLSRAAKIVETLLAHMVEEGKPVSAQFLAALQQTTDLLDEFIRQKNAGPEIEEILYARIVKLFAEFNGNSENGGFIDDVGNLHQGMDEQQEYILAIRYVLPLLQELAGYLSSAGLGGGEKNRNVYGKLSQAVKTLATVGMAAGLQQQSLLMKDFHLLLEKLQSGPLAPSLEIPGLIGDFLLFLETVYTYADPENGTTVQRVKDQLHRLATLLSMSGRVAADVTPEVPATEHEEDIFGAPEPEGDSLMLLEEVADGLLFEEQAEESLLSAYTLEEADQEQFLPSEQDKETISEEQQQLLDIFRSECEEHLIVINHSLNILENEVKEFCPLSSNLRETVGVMRRAVHTLKGAAAMTGMNLTARGAHSLEDMLDWIHDDATEISPEEVQILATGIDVIELLSQSMQADESVHLDRLVKTIGEYLALRTETGQPAGSGQDETTEVQAYAGSSEEVGDADAGLEVETLSEPSISANLPGESGILRVKLDDLDELAGIEGELVVARGAIEKMLEEFSDTLLELDTVKENLRRKSQELESGFEVQSLYGFSPRTGDDAGGSDYSEFDPIELDRYSQLNLIIRSLNEISVDVNSIHTTLVSLVGDIGGQVGKQQLTMRLMQEKLMRIRMTPMSSLSRVLFRTVRETARKLEKKANLSITGEDVYMDRFVWAKITDPLMHMLRNALDHGIESPEKRIAAGKPESGTIRVEADQHSRFVVLRISDDGGGIDLERIKERLRNGDLAENPDALSEKELLEFLFHPSFSTRQDISAISGRGIGLDVVRRNIQDLMGSVQLFNNPGQGVTFEIRIPFTLSVNRAVLVSVVGRVFAIPLQDIHQIKRFAVEELEENDGIFLKQGDNITPIVNLGFCLHLEKRLTELPTGREGILAILFNKGEKLFAVCVDEVVEQREIIVKSLGSHLTHVPGISGVTLTGSGGLIPIVNLREIIDAENLQTRAAEEPELKAGLDEPLKVLIVDDSISVRHSVARLVESQGWKQQQAVDGIEALARLEIFVPDVIILDIEMPRMNGYEFKSNINNNKQFKDIPVVMLTSRTSEKHQQKAKELGVWHYMTKPYNEEAFVKVLEKVRSRLFN